MEFISSEARGFKYLEPRFWDAMEVITLAFKKRDFPITYSINRAWHLHITLALNTNLSHRAQLNLNMQCISVATAHLRPIFIFSATVPESHSLFSFYYLRYYYIVALRYNFQEKEQLTSSRMAQSKMSSLLLLFSLLRPIHLYSIFEKSSLTNGIFSLFQTGLPV